jgi:hypothetical protein
MFSFLPCCFFFTILNITLSVFGLFYLLFLKALYLSLSLFYVSFCLPPTYIFLLIFHFSSISLRNSNSKVFHFCGYNEERYSRHHPSSSKSPLPF